MDVIEEIRQLCAKFLGGPWKNARNDQLTVRRFESGLANRKFYCSLSREAENSNGNPVPIEVVVHLNGQTKESGESWINLVGSCAETVVISKLSSMNLAPQLYGVFPGGRIEEFIPSRQATSNTFQDPEMIAAVAAKMAKIHSLDMPISKEADRAERFKHLFTRCEKPKLNSPRPTLQALVDKVFDFPLLEELNWFISVTPNFETKPVFCHNDLVLQNILIRSDTDETSKKPLIIDFEACGYYYRGFDIAYFLQMRKVDFVYTKQQSSFTVKHDPDEKSNDLKFLTTYLATWLDCVGTSDTSVDNLEHLHKEVNFFVLLLYLFHVGILRIILNRDISQNENLSDELERYYLDITEFSIPLYQRNKMEICRCLPSTA